MKMKILLSAVLSLAVMSLYGCGGGGGGGTPAPGSTTTISGAVVKGPVNGSDIAVFPVKADGTVDTAPIGTGKSAADGSYAITLTTNPTGPVVVEVKGGTF